MSELILKGRITHILDLETGQTKAGKAFEKISFVVNTDADYNPETCFQIFSMEGSKSETKVQDFKKHNNIGDVVEVKFNAHSREHEGRWYNSLDAWWIEKLSVDEPVHESEDVGNTSDKSSHIPF